MAPKGPAAKGMWGSELVLSAGYDEMRGGLKAQVRQAQFRAHRVVNEQLIELYWNIGREILTQQGKQDGGEGSSPGRPRSAPELTPPKRGFLLVSSYHHLPSSTNPGQFALLVPFEHDEWPRIWLDWQSMGTDHKYRGYGGRGCGSDDLQDDPY